MMATRSEVSAGGVVMRRVADSLEVALIATHGGTRWALPKGLLNQGESPEETAGREVREETGLEARILGRLDPVDYWFWWGKPGQKVRHHKQVHFFAMLCLGGDTTQHDAEVDEVRWFPIEEAIRQAAYRGERQVIEQARAFADVVP